MTSVQALPPSSDSRPPVTDPGIAHEVQGRAGTFKQWEPGPPSYLRADVPRRTLDPDPSEHHDPGTGAGELRELQSHLSGLGSLPKAIAPGEDLRPGIHARIRLAAAALLLVVLSSAATLFLAPGPVRPDRPAVAAVSPSPATVDAAFARFQHLEAEYLRAADELRRALERREGALDPATAELLRRNLRVIDQAIRESRSALLSDPGSEMLRQMVLAAHERKLEMLRRAEILSATS